MHIHPNTLNLSASTIRQDAVLEARIAEDRRKKLFAAASFSDAIESTESGWAIKDGQQQDQKNDPHTESESDLRSATGAENGRTSSGVETDREPEPSMAAKSSRRLFEPSENATSPISYWA